MAGEKHARDAWTIETSNWPIWDKNRMLCLLLSPAISITSTNHNTPFVLGTSLPPVRSIASRIASAKALNADSALIQSFVDQKYNTDVFSLTCGGHSRHAEHPRAMSPPLQLQTSGRYVGSSPSTVLLFSPVSAAIP